MPKFTHNMVSKNAQQNSYNKIEYLHFGPPRISETSINVTIETEKNFVSKTIYTFSLKFHSSFQVSILVIFYLTRIEVKQSSHQTNI